MTKTPIVDDDLEQVISHLAFAVRRIHQLEDMLLEPDLVSRYKDLARMTTERADLLDNVRIKAETLHIDARALVLIVDEAEKYRGQGRRRRKLSLDKLAEQIGQARPYAERARAEANADLISAQLLAKVTTARAAAIGNAITYLEASRS